MPFKMISTISTISTIWREKKSIKKSSKCCYCYLFQTNSSKNVFMLTLHIEYCRQSPSIATPCFYFNLFIRRKEKLTNNRARLRSKFNQKQYVWLTATNTLSVWVLILISFEKPINNTVFWIQPCQINDHFMR